MHQLPRNLYIGTLFAIACIVYVIAGYATQVIHGTPVGVAFGEVMGMAVGAAAVVGLLVYAAVSWVARKSNADPNAKIRIGGMPAIVSAVILVAVAGAGSAISMDRNADHDKFAATAAAAKSARERAAATESARVAALSPEQVATEKRAKELAAENSKKAQEAVTAAAAEVEMKKNLRLERQAMVIESLKILRASMKDPDTFELKEVLMMETGSGCIIYRARNSFGAALKGSAVLSVPVPPKNGAKSKDKIQMIADGQDGFSTAWNKSCANQSGDDMTRTAKRVLNWD